MWRGKLGVTEMFVSFFDRYAAEKSVDNYRDFLESILSYYEETVIMKNWSSLDLTPTDRVPSSPAHDLKLECHSADGSGDERVPGHPDNFESSVGHPDSFEPGVKHPDNFESSVGHLDSLEHSVRHPDNFESSVGDPVNFESSVGQPDGIDRGIKHPFLKSSFEHSVVHPDSLKSLMKHPVNDPLNGTPPLPHAIDTSCGLPLRLPVFGLQPNLPCAPTSCRELSADPHSASRRSAASQRTFQPPAASHTALPQTAASHGALQSAAYPCISELQQKPTFPCSECNKSFSTRFRLRVHLRLHTGEKPYVCSFCGKGFVDRGNFGVHLRVHTRERPYRCEVCGRQFSTKGNLSRHEQSQHAAYQRVRLL